MNLPSKVDTEAQAAMNAFLEAVGKLNPLEITWAFNILSDHAKKSIKDIEDDVIRHERFGRKEAAQKAYDRISFNEKLIELCKLWKEAEMQYSAPLIVAAVMEKNGIKPKVAAKKVKNNKV